MMIKLESLTEKIPLDLDIKKEKSSKDLAKNQQIFNPPLEV